MAAVTLARLKELLLDLRTLNGGKRCEIHITPYGIELYDESKADRESELTYTFDDFDEMEAHLLGEIQIAVERELVLQEASKRRLSFIKNLPPPPFAGG